MTRLTSLECWRASWPPFLISRAGVLVVGVVALLHDRHPAGCAAAARLRQRSGQPAAALGRRLVHERRAHRLHVDAARRRPPAERRVLPGVPDGDARDGPVVRRQRRRVPVWRPGDLARGVSLGVGAALPARARRSWRCARGGRSGDAAGQLPLFRVPRRRLHRVAVPARRDWRGAGLQARALGSRLPLGRACRVDAAQRCPAVADGRSARIQPASEAAAGRSAASAGRWTRRNRRPIAGAAIYWLFLWQFTGNPFQWSEQHEAWGRTLGSSLCSTRTRTT